MNRLIDQEWVFRKVVGTRTYDVNEMKDGSAFISIAYGIRRRERAIAIAAVPKMLKALRRAYFLTSKPNVQPYELRAELAKGIDAAEKKS